MSGDQRVATRHEGQFQPGHAAHPKNPLVGPLGAQRLAQRSLAQHIREAVDIGDIVRRLNMMAQGVDPVSQERLSAVEQRAAIEMILDRGWGRVAQLVDVEARIEAHVRQTVEHTVDMSSLSDLQLEAIEAALGVAGVIDVESEDP